MEKKKGQKKKELKKKNSKGKSSKKDILKENNLEESNSTKSGLKENSSTENNLKDNNLKENSPKENSIRENNLKKDEPKEIVSKDNNAKESDLKDNNVKESISKENNSKGNSSKDKSSKKKLSKKKKTLIIIAIILGVIIAIVATGCGYGYYLYSKVDNDDLDRSSVLNEEGKKEEYEEIINIALFGTDTTESTRGLSDCNMILTINPDTNEIKLTSLMRDIHVNIPGHGENNLNMAMMDGGPQLSLKTINENFDLDLDKYICVNLNSLPQIIDKVGGVEIDVTSEEVDLINSYARDINNRNGTSENYKVKNPGKQLLNGTQATAYCRIRYTEGNDFKRTERQRTVFEQIFKKITTLSIGEISSFIDEVLPLVTTNLKYTEIFSIGMDLLSMKDVTIQQSRFPEVADCESGQTEAGYTLYIDKEVTIQKLHKFIYNKE